MLRRMLVRLFAVRALLAVLAMTLTVRAASAAPEADRTAARHFADGQKAFVAGDYRHAADEFEAAYRDKPHHAPLWNAARSWQRAGEEIRAANLYARYLREAPPDAPDRDQATAALRALTARMGRIEPHAAGVDKPRLDGKEVDAPVVYVAPGEHVAEADDKGTHVRKVVTVRAGEQVSVTLAPEPKPAPVAKKNDTPIGPPPPPRKPLPPVAVVAGGLLTLAAGAVAVVSGLDTVSKRDAFLDDKTQPRLDEAYKSQTRTNIIIGTTVAVAVVTGVIAVFFTDWGGDAPRNAQVGAR